MVAYNALAQDQTTSTYFDELLNALDELGYTNFTAVVRLVTADSAYPTFSQLLSDTSTNKTLFIPDNVACKFTHTRLLIHHS